MNDINRLEVAIAEITFNKSGFVKFEGFVSHSNYVTVTIDTSSADFDRVLPRVDKPYTFKDKDDLCNAVLDDFQNLHWLIKFDTGQVVERVVNLTNVGIDLLFERYMKSK